MPRKVRDSNLETRTARSKLKARAKPYYRLIEPGLHLGYRNLPSGPGTWIARRYKGEGAYTTENLRDPANNIVLADDFTDADGVRVLTFGQAQQQARRASPRSAVMTISDVLDRYIGRLDTDGRSPRDIADARTRIDAHIRPALGTITIGALTTERLRTWLADVAAAPSRLRSSTGKQKYGAVRDDRARQATANRIWAILRAALNAAFEDGKISSDTVWRRVKPFKNAGAARQRRLSVEEARRLVNACDPDFRLLVQAALQTGARYGELCRLTVADFNRDAGTIAVLKSKSGKPRHVIVTDEGRAFFGPPAVPVVRYYYVNATVARDGR